MNYSQQHKELKAWIVTADMGYGHQRAVFPLRKIAEGGIITAGSNETSAQYERKLWRRVLGAYEFLSRAKSIPLIGSSLFTLLDKFLHIPSTYPERNLTGVTFQVNLLESSIKKGLCSGMIEKVKEKNLPLVTSFYAPAIAADEAGIEDIYCIICDTDMNRVWVPKEPAKSRIKYFAPCISAVRRLKMYGVPDDKIYLTGFPLPDELTGGASLNILKNDLRTRLKILDPENKFHLRHEQSINHFLGEENVNEKADRKITITYCIGGAGAQKEIGIKIISSLKNKLKNGKVKINIAAGSKKNVHDYFVNAVQEICGECANINLIYSANLHEYFSNFNEALRNTDILWTKPSELSFYTALGIPVIMTPSIGSQESFNKKWLMEIHAGLMQENPDYTDQWLFDLINRGVLAEMAWAGFLKARKLGTSRIIEVLKTGRLTPDESPVLR